MEYTGYVGEADIAVHACNVLASFGCRSGIDQLTGETGVNVEMHLITVHA